MGLFWRNKTQTENQTSAADGHSRAANLALVGGFAGLLGWIAGCFFKVKDHASRFQRLSRRHVTILETAADVVATLTPEGNVISLNPAFEKATGWSSKAWVGRPFQDLVENDGETELRVKKRDGGNVVLQFSRVPQIEDGVIREVIGVGKDITQQRALESELRRINENLEAEVNRRTLQLAERAEELRRNEENLNSLAVELKRSNQELEGFAQVISHDLREPIRTVSSFLQLLNRKLEKELDAESKKYISYAVDGVSRMDALVKGLMEFSTAGPRPDGKLTRVESSELVESVLHDLKNAIEEQHATIEIGDLPSVAVNPTQMRQVFQNLISNSLKYRGDAAPQIRISCQAVGSEYVFSVCDNGMGLDMKHADRIFDLFHRLHSSEDFPGTGLGLSLCKKFVENHRGRIWVESVPDKGSTFRFAIPN